jgi:hypothetical protein
MESFGRYKHMLQLTEHKDFLICISFHYEKEKVWPNELSSSVT